jgi:hypothetical protein
MPGDSRRITGDITGYLIDNCLLNSEDYLALANMAGKLLQQLQVGKAQPDRLNSAKNLALAGPNYFLGGIQDKLISPN